MHTQRSEHRETEHNVTVAEKRNRVCQSPLACGNKASMYNFDERKFLCGHCQGALDDMKTGIDILFW